MPSPATDPSLNLTLRDRVAMTSRQSDGSVRENNHTFVVSESDAVIGVAHQIESQAAATLVVPDETGQTVVVGFPDHDAVVKQAESEVKATLKGAQPWHEEAAANVESSPLVQPEPTTIDPTTGVPVGSA